MDADSPFSFGVWLAHACAPVRASKARTTPSVSIVKTRPLPTTGAAARREVSELPRPACTVKARVAAVPSASCPIDLVALPPDWVHSLFSTGVGSVIGSAAVAGSAVTSPSPVSTAMRFPRTGVLLCLPLLNTPQPLAASATATTAATRKYLDFVILGPTGPGSGSLRRRRCRATRRLPWRARGFRQVRRDPWQLP